MLRAKQFVVEKVIAGALVPIGAHSLPPFYQSYINIEPTVKIFDPATKIQCDINVNDQLGLFNTQMIADYCRLIPTLAPLLLAIKKWAKSWGLNNPSGHGGAASFSSYALTLMTIGYLQVRRSSMHVLTVLV